MTRYTLRLLPILLVLGMVLVSLAPSAPPLAAAPLAQTSIPVRQISAGGFHTCAITSTGSLRCWGNNASGQTDVPADLGPVTQVSSGGHHTCAITVTGTLRC